VHGAGARRSSIRAALPAARTWSWATAWRCAASAPTGTRMIDRSIGGVGADRDAGREQVGEQRRDVDAAARLGRALELEPVDRGVARQLDLDRIGVGEHAGARSDHEPERSPRE
jgi:hypothetical protein